MYELFICLSITWAGCGVVNVVPVESKAECFELLREVRFQDKGTLATGEKPTESMAYCRPKKS